MNFIVEDVINWARQTSRSKLKIVSVVVILQSKRAPLVALFSFVTTDSRTTILGFVVFLVLVVSCATSLCSGMNHVTGGRSLYFDLHDWLPCSFQCLYCIRVVIWGKAQNNYYFNFARRMRICSS